MLFSLQPIEMISAKRPDIEIVGDELHPVGKIKDFSPYVAKIKASGADSVVTGNWGNDLSLLVKAGKEAGLDVNYFTYYAGIVGTTGTIGQAGIDKVKQVSMWHNNLEGELNESLTLPVIVKDFQKQMTIFSFYRYFMEWSYFKV